MNSLKNKSGQKRIRDLALSLILAAAICSPLYLSSCCGEGSCREEATERRKPEGEQTCCLRAEEAVPGGIESSSGAGEKTAAGSCPGCACPAYSLNLFWEPQEDQRPHLLFHSGGESPLRPKPGPEPGIEPPPPRPAAA